MNAEKVYASAIAALKGIVANISETPEGAKKIFGQVMNNPEEWEHGSPFLYELGKLAREAKEEIVSKDGKKDALAACKAIIKVAKGINHEEIHGAWIDKDGWQVVCDSFRAVRMKDHLEALPSAQGSDFIGRVWESARGNSVEVKLPTIGEVKAFIASEKAAGKKDFRYDFGEGMPAVNAKYLLDLLKIGLDETAMISKKAPLISAIYMRGEGVEAFLMPVRKENKQEEE